MKFRNPWIDPRITRVRLEDVQAYLTRHGWNYVGPAADPNLLRYERAEGAEEAPTLFVPVRAAEKGQPLERLIEFIGELSHFEERWAVDVLGDILQHSGATNGTPGATPVEQPETVNQ